MLASCRLLLIRSLRPSSCRWRYLSTHTSSEHPLVQTTIQSNGIAHVLLNRPDKLNSLNIEMFEAIAKEVSLLKKNRSVRVVLLGGRGRAFCTGLDVKSIVKNQPLASVERLLERPSGYSNDKVDDESHDDSDTSIHPLDHPFGNLAQDVGYLWRSLPVPVICHLHGMCFGGGLQIALGADLRLASPDCQLSIMETKWGLIPDMSASVTLRELVRMDVAKELTMTGRIVSGREAADLGLVTRCVDDPLKEAQKLAETIVQRSPDSLALAKRLYQETWVAPEKECLQVETDLQRRLLASWNQLAAAGRNFGVNVPYRKRKDEEEEET